MLVNSCQIERRYVGSRKQGN